MSGKVEANDPSTKQNEKQNKKKSNEQQIKTIFSNAENRVILTETLCIFSTEEEQRTKAKNSFFKMLRPGLFEVNVNAARYPTTIRALEFFPEKAINVQVDGYNAVGDVLFVIESPVPFDLVIEIKSLQAYCSQEKEIVIPSTYVCPHKHFMHFAKGLPLLLIHDSCKCWIKTSSSLLRLEKGQILFKGCVLSDVERMVFIQANEGQTMFEIPPTSVCPHPSYVEIVPRDEQNRITRFKKTKGIFWNGRYSKKISEY